MTSNNSRVSIIAVVICGWVLGQSASVLAIETPQAKAQSYTAKSESTQNNGDELVPDAETLAETLYRKAYALYQKKNYRDSIDLLDQAIASNSENADVYSLKSYCHAELKDYEAAMLAAKHAVAINPEDAGLYDLVANNAFFLNDVDTAIENYRRSLDLNGRNARVYNNYLSALKDEKRWMEVKQVYAEFEKLQDRDDIDEISRFEGDIHFYASIAYQESGDNTSALRLLEKAIEVAPDFGGYYVNRGNIRNDEKNFTQALVDFNRAIELNPKDNLAYFNRGNTFLLMKNYKQAVKDFLKAQKLGKQDESIFLNLGNAHKGAGQYQSALDAYNNVLKINPGNQQVKNNLAILQGLMGDTDRSSNTYRQAQQSGQGQEIPLYNQAVDLMRQSKFDSAVPLLIKALDANPDFMEAYNQLGICYLKKKQHLLAQQTLSKAIALFPEDGQLHANRAAVFNAMGDLVSAERDYMHAIKQAPTLVSVYGDLAAMFQTHGDLAKAKLYFDLAEQAGVETHDYYANRIAFLINAGEAKKAVSLGETGLKRHPDNVNLMLNLSSAYQDIRQTKKAVRLLENIIEIDPENSAAQHNLGIYYQEEGDCLKAIDYFKAAIKKDGSRIEPYLSLAACYESLSEYEDAENSYRQMTLIFPDRYEVYYNRGNYRHRQGMREQSAQDFERSFALMEKEQPSSTQNAANESNRYSLLKANGYQTMRRFQEASESYQRYLSFNKTDAEAYTNYAYCLVEIGNPQIAIKQFESSYKLRSDEIDSLIGLFATHALLNNTAETRKYRRLAEAVLQYPVSADTLDRLTAQGYFYSDKFRQVWQAAFAK